MPTLRKIKSNRITTFPDTLGEDIAYPANHVTEREGKPVLFIGETSTYPTTEVIDHGFLGDEQILKLQIILAYGTNVKASQLRLGVLKMCQRRPSFTLYQMTEHLCCSVDFLTRLMCPQLAGISKGKMPLSNAYGLNKLPHKHMPEFFMQADNLPPAEFLPLIHQKIKELRHEARQSAKRK